MARKATVKGLDRSIALLQKRLANLKNEKATIQRLNQAALAEKK